MFDDDNSGKIVFSYEDTDNGECRVSMSHYEDTDVIVAKFISFMACCGYGKEVILSEMKDYLEEHSQKHSEYIRNKYKEDSDDWFEGMDDDEEDFEW